MPDVFVSYSRRDPDRGAARAIVEGLEAAGLDVFWDQKIPPGEDYSTFTAKQAKRAQCIVVLWSRTATRSTWVRAEADIGRRRKCLVPLTLDGTKPPLEFTPIQCPDFSSWRGEHAGPHWTPFLAAIQRRVAPVFRKSGAPKLQGGSLAAALAPHLPLLRRYSRALHGTQRMGDMLVAATLEAIVADPSVVRGEPRVALYRSYHTIAPAPDLTHAALLLTTLESFEIEESATILDMTVSNCSALLDIALERLKDAPGRLLIIEDESVIAMDLVDLARQAGHSVVAVADTMSNAIEAARQHKPDLILADIQLSDGSSGIDAVNCIAEFSEAPIIFITAFPARLLTGERPEPTFVITKPYSPDMVRSAIFQALYFHPKALG